MVPRGPLLLCPERGGASLQERETGAADIPSLGAAGRALQGKIREVFLWASSSSFAPLSWLFFSFFCQLRSYLMLYAAPVKPCWCFPAGHYCWLTVFTCVAFFYSLRIIMFFFLFPITVLSWIKLLM